MIQPRIPATTARQFVSCTAASLCAFLRARRLPSKRALAALAKLNGRRLERRWPFVSSAGLDNMNLNFYDVLELQYARSRRFGVLVIGAFDGVANDPLCQFIMSRDCWGIFVEPQPLAFARLTQNLGAFAHFRFINAAVDRQTGTRKLFHVPPGIRGFPPWTEQLASFSKEHIAKHEHAVPGLSDRIVITHVDTISFEDLIATYQIGSLDVLQIDAEGTDAMLLGCFPFDRLQPAVVHYEIAHMSPGELTATRARLQEYGYGLYATDSTMDEMAVRI